MKQFFAILLTCLMTTAMAADTYHDAYVAIYDNILQANADQAIASCKSLRDSFDDTEEVRQQAFIQLTEDWAKVRVSYILGGYDMAAMDYPTMVDYFHTGKEDIHAALARAIADTNPPARALYKNSYRSLGALDDVLFSGDWSPRRKALAEVISTHVCANIARIGDAYRAHREAYLSDPDKALSLLVNAEIENLYKTREWRIAEVSGLTKQTLGKYLPQNLEYRYSGASWPVIGAIIATHASLLSADQQPNIATIARAKHADVGIENVQKALRMAEKAYHETPPDKAFDMRYVIPIFQGLQDMQKAFYRQVLGSLGVTARIIDADGD